MHETIAVVFDFDDTLGPDSTTAFVESLGVDEDTFWRKKVQPLVNEGWDLVPAYMYKMLHLQARSGEPITRADLIELGKQLTFYPGALEIFSRIRAQVQTANPLASVEFYLVSSGLGDILRHSPVASEFKAIWASDFHYDDSGAISFPRNVVSFTDKTRHLFHIAKGFVGPDFRGKPLEVNRKVADLRIPMDQMVYVGDGFTDVPCFSLIEKSGGIALGVFDPEKQKRWARAWNFVLEKRVANLLPADYSEGEALNISLLMAVDSIAKRIKQHAAA